MKISKAILALLLFVAAIVASCTQKACPAYSQADEPAKSEVKA